MADQDAKSEFRGMLLGLVGVVIFGLTLPMTRLALVDLDPVFVGLGRGIVAAMVAGTILLATRQPLPRLQDLPGFAVTAAGVVIGFPTCATLAMLYAPAGHGGVVLAALPLATAVAGAIIARERPSVGFWLCSIAGCIIVLVFAWLEGASAGALHWADMLLILAVVLAAIGYAKGGVLSRTYGGWQVICWTLVLSLPVLLVIVWLWAMPPGPETRASAWAGFVYVALCSQLFGFFAWNAGLALGGVARVGQTQLIQPFVTLAGAAVLLGEIITSTQIIFAAIVVSIVAISRKMAIARPGGSAT